MSGDRIKLDNEVPADYLLNRSCKSVRKTEELNVTDFEVKEQIGEQYTLRK